MEQDKQSDYANCNTPPPPYFGLRIDLFSFKHWIIHKPVDIVTEV